MPRKIGMKSGTDLNQCRKPSIYDHLPLRGLHDTAQDLQRRAFTRAVVANNAKRLTALHLERNILQRPELSLILEIKFSAAKDLSGHCGDEIAQGVIYLAFLEFLIDMVHAERDIRHWIAPVDALCKGRFQVFEKNKTSP